MQNQDLPRGMNDKPGLIPRQVMPENLESLINNILSWITPTEMYYASEPSLSDDTDAILGFRSGR
ncbi:hypothetical protein [Desulfosporosinus shakirovi]|uniref:hypothetical protein n=1 Tax=Desulfosporosinus shakirovi TaxID=2885154 RepID=UPI001E3909B6|nr:hypothetical protein [Desulfosporosinus sp. SRJS8]MCB8815638.1 hypothetical protein [Desulfosporosinus sp. SRJS8]